MRVQIEQKKRYTTLTNLVIFFWIRYDVFMRKALIILLLSSVLLFIFSLAGMLYVGMVHTDVASDCVGETCVPTHQTNANDLLCLNHCLSVASPDVSVPSIFVSILVIVLFISGFLSVLQNNIVFIIQRWRNTIQLFYRRRQLCTVILLD